MAGKLSHLFSNLTGHLEHKTHKHVATANPAQVLADLYRGSFDFVDPVTNKKHKISVSAELAIAIDGKKLDGKIVGISTNELTFLDHFGYELIISCKEGFPVTIYDEAEDQTYTIIYPDLDGSTPDKDDSDSEAKD
ncbi:DUF4828 domain-containing protein [Lacticaseibacillus zhaodongensis]|uniref:DUF4828 domain-containing protein n=1 Tax=Lacticaseibacillus zhaodongensis TaxID=2668065 RepID=UPI0018AFD99D|nr:DUF4828 domain-containing protein [Lacticaseibacillus zhaodongensis]